jgi:hypothetical protein
LSDLTKITAELGEAYKTWKDGEKDKDEFRKQFFTAIDEQLAQEKSAEKYVTIVATDEEQARDRLAKKYPTWKVDEIRLQTCSGDTDGDGDCSRQCPDHCNRPKTWEAILAELTVYAPYTFVNAADGKVYQRQVSAGSVYIDDERLREENPELWVKVTEIPNRDLILLLLDEYDASERDPKPEVVLDEMWSLEGRVLKSLDSLDADTLAALSEYIYEGKPTIKLAAPRKAKAEELE